MRHLQQMDYLHAGIHENPLIASRIGALWFDSSGVMVLKGAQEKVRTIAGGEATTRNDDQSLNMMHNFFKYLPHSCSVSRPSGDKLP
jgi:hypothetical protein